MVFVDFDGTICHDRYWRSLPADKQPLLQALLFGRNRDIVHQWMRGHRTAEEVNGLAAAELGMSYGDLWAIFVADCQTMTIAPGTLGRLAALRPLANLVLITGNMDSFSRFTVPALGLDRYFDAISNSFTEGKLKTDDDGALFLRNADQFGARLADCTLIDDGADVCALFTRLGGRAIRVTAEHSVDSILDELLRG